MLDVSLFAAAGALFANLPDDTLVALDPSNPVHRTAIELFLGTTQRTPDRYPGLHAALAAGGAAAAPIDDATQVDLGADVTGNTTARTWIACRGLPHIAGAITMVFDVDGGHRLAVGSATQVGEGMLQVHAGADTATPAAPRQAAITIHYVVPSDGSPVRFGALRAARATAPLGVAFNVTAPQPQISGHTYIKIGINRPNSQVDCDYWFNEPTQPTPDHLLTPFVGSITGIPYPIIGATPGQPVPGLTVDSKIYVKLSTGMVSPLIDPAGTASKIVATSANSLSWNWPWSANMPSSGVPNYSGTYDAGAQDTTSAFYFSISVPVDDPSSPYTFAVCSYDTPGKPAPVCFQIPDLYFTWHCLAPDTQVLLADGTAVPITSCQAPMRVRTGAGTGTLAVEANWQGGHGRGACVRLTTGGKSGRSLVSTTGHAIMTPGGLVAAGDLKVGDLVTTIDGELALTALDPVDAGGPMWNLMLGDADDRTRAMTLVGTFVANGFVVGDFAAQGRLHRQRAANLEYMTPRLRPGFVTDYASALADRQAGR